MASVTEQFRCVVHDVKLLLLRIAHGENMSQDSHGGSRATNLALVPHLITLGAQLLLDMQASERSTLVAEQTAFVLSPSAAEGDACYHFALGLWLMATGGWHHHWRRAVLAATQRAQAVGRATGTGAVAKRRRSIRYLRASPGGSFRG